MGGVHNNLVQVTLVSLGPFTNIALAIALCPELVRITDDDRQPLLERLVIMGGNVHG
jgi:inosine-uridine nucleoside N-ribohydrolase